MPSVQENEQKFAEWGLGLVRTWLRSNRMPAHMVTDAVHWVAQREEEEKAQETASREEQSRLAREQSALAQAQTNLAKEQKQIARRTLSVTWLAAGAAVAALIVAFLAWLFPRV